MTKFTDLCEKSLPGELTGMHYTVYKPSMPLCSLRCRGEILTPQCFTFFTSIEPIAVNSPCGNQNILEASG